MDDQEILRLIDENLAWAHRIAGNYAKKSIHRIDAQDVKQEAGIALCRAADTYDPTRGIPFQAYARKCISNRLNSLYHTDQELAREQTTLDTPAFLDDVNDETHKDRLSSPDVDAAREAHRNEVRRALATGMGRLTPNQRDILEARSRGESYREIADRLGITKQAVEGAANRALAQMKTSIEAKGVSGPMFMPMVEESERTPQKSSSGCATMLLVIPVTVAIGWILTVVFR